MYDPPLAYFITFRTFGTWLHGDVRGSVDRYHNEFGTPVLKADPDLEAEAEAKMCREAVVLTPAQRVIIDRTIREVCTHKEWYLRALNVRTNHVHAIVSSTRPPEFIMNALKSWGTRRLVEAGEWARGDRLWSRHGSTRYLFKEEDVNHEIKYVMEGQ